jgi:hypothetical protein
MSQSYEVSQSPPRSDAPGSLRDRAISIIAFATVLALSTNSRFPAYQLWT